MDKCHINKCEERNNGKFMWCLEPECCHLLCLSCYLKFNYCTNCQKHLLAPSNINALLISDKFMEEFLRPLNHLGICNTNNNNTKRQKIEFLKEVLPKLKELLKIIDGLERQTFESFKKTQLEGVIKHSTKIIDELKERFNYSNNNSDSDSDSNSSSDSDNDSFYNIIESSSDDSIVEDPNLKETEIFESKQNEKRKIIEVDNSSENSHPVLINLSDEKFINYMKRNFKQITPSHTLDIISNFKSGEPLSSSISFGQHNLNICVIGNKANGTTFINSNNDNKNNLFFIHLIGYKYYWYYIVPTLDVLGLNIENNMEIILKEFSEIYEVLEKTSNKFKKKYKKFKKKTNKQINNR